MNINEWKEVKLGDIADILSGYAFKTKDFVDSGIPVIKIKNIVPPKVDISDVQYVSQELYEEKKKYALKYNDILISMTGSNVNQIDSAVGKIGRVRLKNIKMLLNQRVGKLFVIEQNKVSYDYIYYYLIQEDVRYNLAVSAGGSANQANISPNQIKNVTIKLPPLTEQKSIAHILSTIDEKIEINNQINKNLESMAQETFKHWFVDFEFPNEDGKPYKSSGGEMVKSEMGMIPRGWKKAILGDIADIIMGQSPKGSSYNENNIGTVFYQGRTDFDDRFPIRRLFTTEPKKMAKAGDVLMSVRAPVGDINFAHEDCCVGRGLCSIRSKKLYNSYLYYLMLSLKQKLDVYNGEGTVFGSINKDSLKNMVIIEPCDSVIHMFNKTSCKIDQQYLCLVEENRNLCQIRDTLLQKLMSGEIRVPINN